MTSVAPAASTGTTGQVGRVAAALAAGVLGPDHDPAVPERILALLEMLPSRQDHDRLVDALRLLGSRAGALLLTGSSTPLPARSREAVELLLQHWWRSRLRTRRQLAGVLTSAALASEYSFPGAALARTGYPGPLGPAPQEPRRLEPLVVDGDQELTCDVVVVGSGAGGGVVAAELAAKGADVIVLEKGGYAAEADFHHREAESTRDLYLYGLTIATTDLGVRIVAGSTLGGGTVVNYTTSFKTPPHVLEDWAKVSGSDVFVSGEVEASLDAVAERIGATTGESRPGRRDQLMEAGLRKLGWHVDVLPRDVRGCSQDAACGWCGFGCRLGAKQSTMRTYLEDAASRGARLVVGADVRRVLISGGRATGVEASAGGHRLRVRARAVVAAAGAIETPALLLRSGLGGQVGHNLRLHPGTAAFGVFDEEVRMWEGTLQARYSTELRSRLGEHAPIFETVPVHPGSGSTALPWVSSASHRALMERYANLSLCAVLCRDTAAGQVRVDKGGQPRLHYPMNATDERRAAEGVVAAGQVLAAAGASEVFSMHPARISFRPGQPGAEETWSAATRRAGYRGGRVTFFSYHQMGSCRLGTDPSSSAVGPDHETHEVRGLFVADASVFPTASGVNPMLSIMGLAHRAAGRIAARLG
ncbi:MAG TPA: GMC family oxidoreductase [Actinomycetes bacterium]|nr:GMC family oxidoreductase [Actinomycetes bacterium]